MAKRGGNVGPTVQGVVEVIGDTSHVDASLKKLESNLESVGQHLHQQTEKLEKQIAATTAQMEKLTKASDKALKSRRNWSSAVEGAEARANAAKVREAARAAANTQIQEDNRITNREIENDRRVTAELKQQLRERNLVFRQGLREDAEAAKRIRRQAVPLHETRTSANLSTFALLASQTQMQQRAMQWNAAGYLPHQMLTAAVNQRTFQNIQAQATRFSPVRNIPLAAGGGGGRGGGRGGGALWNALGFGGGAGGIAGRFLGGAMTGLGFGLGAYGIGQGVASVVDATRTATAYDRQEVAARRLAGSQQALNDLMAGYEEASGGAVAQTVALENVTRLLATGFAKSRPELERFVRGTRGASIALGKPQDYIIQETQLAVSNVSQKRLDQIGLGIGEVNDRIALLRTNNKELTREMAFQQTVIDLLNEKYGSLTDTAEGQATGLEKLGKAWEDLRLRMGQGAQSPINVGANFLANAVNWFAQSNAENARIQRIRALNLTMGNSTFGYFGGTEGPAEFFLEQESRNAARHGRRGSARVGAAAPPRFDEDELTSIRDFQSRLEDIESQAQEDRIRETESYESQRSNVIRNYEKTIARDAEDFARQRARSERDYQKSRDDLIEDAAKRDAELTEDYGDRVSDLREDSEKRLSKIEEDYNEDREKREKDHQDAMLKAAGSLDAIAFHEEQKRWKREESERQEAHKEELEDTREALAEQLAEAKEAHDERLADAREADAERLRDMEEARAQQIADEDEDRAIRLARMAEDHQDQLAEMDNQHTLRLKQIEEQAAKEREKWNEEFETFAAELGIYVAGLTEKRAKMDELAEEWFDNMIDIMEKDIANAKKLKDMRDEERMQEVPIAPFSGDPGYANGGAVRRTGKAMVHAGEFVLSRAMLSGHAPVPNSIVNQLGGNRTFNIQEGAIQVTTTPGYEALVAQSIEEQLVEILDRLS